MTFRNANVPHAVLISWPAQTQVSPKTSRWLPVWGSGCAHWILSEQGTVKVFKQEGFFIFSPHTQLEYKFDFMLRFMIQKRSGVICIFWHFKQFTVAQKRILKTCLKSARVVLKEPNGRNQPGYSIVLLILYCQMERATLDNEEQWAFPSLSCPPATCLLSTALLLIFYFNVLLYQDRGTRWRGGIIWSVWSLAPISIPHTNPTPELHWNSLILSL